MLKRARSRRRFAAARQVPAEKLTGMAVDHQYQRGPPVPASPDTIQIG